ncbi:MAG: cation:proton antiporter [Bdellovibrionales bacterium]|nr:cation:proton antiporter [Bdellovibrionales bacterium]
MLYSISFFATLLIPFYFFKAGLNIDVSLLSLNSLWYGLAFLVIFVPIRYANVFMSLHFFLPGCWKSRYQISLSLMPTLIFGLVIASILRDKYEVSPDVVNGLIIYTLVSSIIPSVLLKAAPPEEYDPRLVGSRK